MLVASPARPSSKGPRQEVRPLRKDSFQQWASLLSALAHVEKCGKLRDTLGACEGRLKRKSGRGLDSLGPHHTDCGRIHVAAFLIHWTSGTLPLQGGQIAEWIPTISSSAGVHMKMLEEAPPMLALHQLDCDALTQSCLAWLRAFSRACFEYETRTKTPQTR